MSSFISALFKDSVSDALAVSAETKIANDKLQTVKFTHWVVAGTTSAITFKLRAGGDVGGTVTFNGESSARLLGGALASSMTITEYAA